MKLAEFQKRLQRCIQNAFKHIWQGSEYFTYGSQYSRIDQVTLNSFHAFF